VALSPSQDEATSTQTHPMVYRIAQHHAGIGTTAFVQTFLSMSGSLGPIGFAQKANLSKDKSTNEHE
jgi:hypothetical protein